MNLSELFEDCLLKIFEYIPIIDLIKLKIVNKKFYYLIDQFKFKELIIRGRNNDDFHENQNSWFYRDEKVDIKNTIRLNILEDKEDNNQAIELILFKNYFKHLKYLKIYSNQKFDLNLLNQISIDLEHLEIDSRILYTRDPINLNFSNLKVLSINYLYKLIKINSKLEILSCDRIEECIELSNPECLKQLYLRSYSYENLSKYYNLEQLWTGNKRVDRRIDELPNLKDYHIFYYDYISSDDFDEFNSVFKKRPNLKIHFAHCLISKENTYEDYKFSRYSDNNLEIFRDNYNYLDNKIDTIVSIDYGNLIKTFNYKIPDNFYKKFFNIQKIILNQPVDQNEFQLFLSKLLNLIYLEISYPKFNQHFYENLPQLIPNLQIFELKENDTIKLDFNFLIKFNIIEMIKLNQNLSPNLINHILCNLKFIDELNLLINKKETSILLTKILNKERKFTIIYGNNLPKNNLSINQVLDLLIKYSS